VSLAEAHAVNRALVVSDAVWAMATAVRVATGGTVQDDRAGPQVSRRRFPYAYAGPVRRYWRQFALHLTPRSVYFQQAVRVAVALAAGRLLVGVLDLQHGFWVLLATLTLLRGRALDTRVALRPAAIGTVAGALAAAGLLFVVGNRMEVYAALLPPVLVLAVAAGSVAGLGWGQALFTVAITLVFSQVSPPGVGLAEVRASDVLLGAGLGLATGLLAWPRGAGGELRRAAGRLLDSGGDLVRQTSGQLTAAPPTTAPPTAAPANAAPANATPPAADRGRPALAVEDRGAADRMQDAFALADATYSMYQAERHTPAESTVDWQAILVTGHHLIRGAELLRVDNPPGALAPWSEVVTPSADRVAGECGRMAEAVHRGHDLRAAPVDLPYACDARLVAMLDWLAGIRDDLTRLGGAPR
jgi:uncharacterized membrane protein YccC